MSAWTAFGRSYIVMKGKSPAADELCGELRNSLEHNRVPANAEQKEDILRALVFIENNDVPLYLREVSQMVYGTTKYFEEKTCDAVCRKLRAHYQRPCGHDEMLSEILEDFQIYPEQQRICLKGGLTIQKGGQRIAIGAFPGGIEFAADELAGHRSDPCGCAALHHRGKQDCLLPLHGKGCGLLLPWRLCESYTARFSEAGVSGSSAAVILPFRRYRCRRLLYP